MTRRSAWKCLLDQSVIKRFCAPAWIKHLRKPMTPYPQPVSHSESVTKQVPCRSKVFTSSAVKIPSFSTGGTSSCFHALELGPFGGSPENLTSRSGAPFAPCPVNTHCRFPHLPNVKLLLRSSGDWPVLRRACEAGACPLRSLSCGIASSSWSSAWRANATSLPAMGIVKNAIWPGTRRA
jgi:hypothetical protein